MSKTNAGYFFEDYQIGQVIRHATPRMLGDGDVAMYQALYGPRFALASSGQMLDALIVFHTVFGKTVPDISLNAVANLGYAEGRFLDWVAPGDTLTARSEVIGLKENSNGKTGIVWVRTTGFKDGDTPVLSYVRWVMVRKRDAARPRPIRWCRAWRMPCLRRIWWCLRGSIGPAMTLPPPVSRTVWATTAPARSSTMSMASP